MNDLSQRLSKCFRVVFPELSDSQIESADMTNTARWDSVNHIMLITVIGEEFGIDLDLEDFDRLTSFSGLRECVAAACVPGSGD
jgi:acyl carrier protein